MQRSLKKGGGHAILWAVGWFVGVLILGLGLYFASNLYTTANGVSFADLPPTAAQSAAADTVAQGSAYLDIWLDTGKSMQGFLYTGGSSVIPSAYRAVMDSLPNLAQAVGNTAKAEYYHFNSVFSFLDAASTDADRQQKRDGLVIAWSDFSKTAIYNNKVIAGDKSVSLPSVLNTLNLANPSIILTDFEADGLTLPGDEYEQPLKRIYNAGLCVYVVGMKSAFSGILYNYTNSGEDYAYGTKDAVSTRLPNKNVYSYQARSFYAVIVATGSQCENLKNELQQTYKVYDNAVMNGKDSLQKITGYQAEDYIEFQTANYSLNGTYGAITAVDGKIAKVSAGEGFKSSGSDALGAPEFTCGKTETLKTATLKFNIQPTSAAYSATYKTDVYSIPAVNVQKVKLTYTRADQLKDSDTALNARGNRRVMPYYVDFTDSGNWFLFSKITALPDGITFTLTVDAAQCEAGLYSLTIPVTCTHSTEATELGDAGWIADWTEDSTKLAKDIHDKNFVAQKTLDLKPQLEHFRTTDLELNHQETDDVANLTIHLNIQ